MAVPPLDDRLVDAVARKARLSRVTARKAVKAVIESLPDALAAHYEASRHAPPLGERGEICALQWSDGFAERLLEGFRHGVETELNGHRAAGRSPPAHSPAAVRRDRE